MNHITFRQNGNHITVYGTNDFLDVLTSAQCWPKKGYHAGAYKAAMYVLSQIDELDKDMPVILKGHSMGGSIDQVMATELARDGFNVVIETQGAYPACTEFIISGRLKGLNYIYGNDPVPGLFPWFKYPCDKMHSGPIRKWWKINFKDHLRY